MGVLLKNNAVSRLGSSITAGATSLSVTAGQGSMFPSPGAGEWFPVTLIKATGSLEIVRCTARSGDVLTVTRAQEGTAAQAFTAGDRVELRLTTAVIADVVQQITDLSGAALLDANNLADVADKAAARSNLQLKTGAVTDVTTSASDTTSGRLLKVGDFGIGDNAIVLGTGNADNITASGSYQIGATTTGTLPEALGELVHVERGSSSGALQIFASSTAAKYYMRSKWSDRGWDAWAELYNTRNVPLFMRGLLDDDSAPTARTTLGVPAGVDKQMCTAWVNFNGTGTVAINASHNVSSITDLGTGLYQVNFATAMASDNFSATVNGRADTSGNAGFFIAGTRRVAASSAKNTSSYQLFTSTGSFGSSSVTPSDWADIDVHIFGGK